ncbi:hypothetical protein [Bacillus safensis]|nr:hypothetical protein [Bacillus safensis]
MADTKLWVRNMYTGPGGGAYTGPEKILIWQYIHLGHYLLMNFRS